MKLGGTLARLLAVALIYFCAAKLGMSVPVGDGRVSPVWPPAGLSLAILSIMGRRYGLGVFVGSYLVAWHSGGHALVLLAGPLALGAATEGIIGTTLLRRLGVDRRLGRVRDVLALVGTAGTCAAVAATIGVTTLVLGHRIPVAHALSSLGVWWVGDVMGMLVLVPVAYTLAPRTLATLRRGPEALALAVVLVVTCAIVFGSRPNGALVNSPAFLVFPIAIWAALRFGPRGAALVAASISIVAIVTTSMGRGPFGVSVTLNGVIVLQLFMGTVHLTALLLAAATAEREAAAGQVALLAAAVRASSEAVLITDAGARPEGPRILFANEALSRVTGYEQADVLGRTPALLGRARGSGPTHASEWLTTALGAGQAAHVETAILRRDGAEVEVDMQLAPVPSDGSAPTHFVLTCRDVTERNRIRAKLALAERMATVGTLAAGVGHEINTPLGFIITNLQGLAQRLSNEPTGDGDVLALVRDSLDGAEKIRVIVRDLKILSRDSGEEKTRVDLERVMGVALKTASHEIGLRAKVVSELGAAPRVLANEGRLGQVCLNLLVNAAQAMDPQRTDNELRVRTGTAPDGRALVEVEDTGAGIPADVLPRVFEPFFTTKGPGGGTGLGLSLCHQIVSACGGEITVESTEGRGTTFRVLLPHAEGTVSTPRPPPAPEPATPRTDRRGRILVIDDEIRFARSLRWLLEPEHEVTVTSRGEEALGWLNRGDVFDVILCDLQMPELSGIDLHARISESLPDHADRMIFVSGGAVTPEAQSFVSTVKNKVLDKPVPPETLRAVIAEMMTSRMEPAE
jgi:PAS domain S-box-containing protein